MVIETTLERLTKTDKGFLEILEHSPRLVRFNVPPGDGDGEDSGSVPINQTEYSSTAKPATAVSC